MQQQELRYTELAEWGLESPDLQPQTTEQQIVGTLSDSNTGQV